MLMRSTRSRSPNSVSARSCARWVFPTPVGPTKRKTPNGRRTFVNPDLMRPIIRTMVRTASLCPRRCPDRSVSIRDKSSGIAGSISIRGTRWRSEEHTSELQSLTNLVCRLLLEKKTAHALNADTDQLGKPSSAGQAQDFLACDVEATQLEGVCAAQPLLADRQAIR